MHSRGLNSNRSFRIFHISKSFLLPAFGTRPLPPKLNLLALAPGRLGMEHMQLGLSRHAVVVLLSSKVFFGVFFSIQPLGETLYVNVYICIYATYNV